LYLVARDNRSQSWVFMWRRGGKRWQKGEPDPRQEWWLGEFPDLGVGDARDLAAKGRGWLANGLDPRVEREKERLANEPKPDRSFGMAAEQLIASRSAKWRTRKHKHAWVMTLLGRDLEGNPSKFDYCQDLRPKRVQDITVADVKAVLDAIWTSKPETAARLRARIEGVLDFAKSLKWRTGDNVAAWRGHFENLLPEKGEVSPVKPHRAMPFKPTRHE